jgi:hypothetical protein
MGGAKLHIHWAHRGHLVLDPVPAGAGGNKIEFVVRVRNLRAVCGSCDEPGLEVKRPESVMKLVEAAA